ESAEAGPGGPSLPQLPAARKLLCRRGWLALALIAMATFVAGIAFGWPWLQAQLDSSDGLRLAREGHFSEAEPLLQRALPRQPDHLALVKALALGQLEANKFAEAEGMLQRWCDLTPHEAEPFKQRINLHLRLKRQAQALADAQQVLKLEPDQD